MANIPWRRPDELRHTVSLHVLRHVEPDHRVAAAKVLLRQHFGDLSLADTRGAHEQHARDRALGVLEPAAGAHERRCQLVDCVVLSNDVLLHHRRQPHEARLVVVAHGLGRDARPRGHNVLNVARVDDREAAALLCRATQLAAVLALTAVQDGRLLEELILDGFMHGVEHLQVIRDARVLLDKRGAARVVRLDARPAACLIQQVYRLVGQEAVSNVLLA
mmetsp:Transcript_39880/g.118758  ORF Transcript_39880/g.118758 Transcript_39880/m.118758 type:complete len:219 (-) Transcript_39880:1620-2276(-)